MSEMVKLTFDNGISEEYENLFCVNIEDCKYNVLREIVTKQIFVKRRIEKKDGSLFYDTVDELQFNTVYNIYMAQKENVIKNFEVVLEKINIEPDLPRTKATINRIFSLKAFPVNDYSCNIEGNNSYTIDISRFRNVVFCATLLSAIGKHGEIKVDLRIFNENGSLCCYYNIPIVVDNAETQIMINIPIVSSDRVFSPGNYVAYMSIDEKAYKSCDFAIVYGNNYSKKEEFKEKTEEPVEKAAREFIGTIRDAVEPKYKFTYGLFSYLAQSGIFIAFMSLVLMIMGIMPISVGVLFFFGGALVSAGILMIYIKKIPPKMKMKAIMTFLLHGLYLNFMALMVFSLVLIPVMIYILNYRHYRYELCLVDGVYVYVKYEV